MNQSRTSFVQSTIINEGLQDYKSIGVVRLQTDFIEAIEESNKIQQAYREVFAFIDEINRVYIQLNDARTGPYLSKIKSFRILLEITQKSLEDYEKQLSELSKHIQQNVPQDEIHSYSIMKGYGIINASLTGGYTVYDNNNKNILEVLKIMQDLVTGKPRSDVLFQAELVELDKKLIV